MLDLSFEEAAWSDSIQAIAGVDEVGRGPLAGPVVAAAAVLIGHCHTCHPLIRDSKKLSEKQRQEVDSFIRQNFYYAIGVAEVDEIDAVGILSATFLAARRALNKLPITPQFVVFDGNQAIPGLSIKQQTIIKGDNTVYSIAAASIMAKVHRDGLMAEVHQVYPEYGFDKHKGYGTSYHLEQISKLGPCVQHRKTFYPITKYYA